jgi:hypothetical protein
MFVIPNTRKARVRNLLFTASDRNTPPYIQYPHPKTGSKVT